VSQATHVKSVSRGHAIIDDRRALEIVTAEGIATVPQRSWCVAARIGAGVRLDTRRPACSGHPRCREIATYVHDPGHCEPPDDRRGNSSVPGCGEKSQAVRSSLADRIRERKKKFCRVTTCRRNFWCWNGLGRGLGPLTARSFRLGMLGFDRGGLATFGLPLCRQPAVELPPAFRILAVALVPALRLVLATAPFAQASARARAASSGVRAVLFRTLTGAHGRLVSQGKARGECVSILPEHYQNAN
jgi:hypothetical protein